MAINTLSPASVQKNSLMLYPAGSATSDYGILVYDNSNTNVATKIENVRFHLLVPDTEDVKVSLYTKNPASQYFAIAENIPLKDITEYVGATVTIIDESTPIWLSNVSGQAHQLFARVSDQGEGKVQVIIDYEIFSDLSTMPIGTSDHNALSATASNLIIPDTQTKTWKVYKNNGPSTGDTVTWSVSGPAATYLTPTSGTINLTNGVGSVDITASGNGSNTYLGTLTATSGSLQATTTVEVAEAGLYSFSSFTFTNGTQTGRPGPSLSNLLAAYDTVTYPWLNDTANFNVGTNTAGIQEWTVPQTASYTIEAIGARGAKSGTNIGDGLGSYGARIIGTFSLTQGDIVKIAVGQAGKNGNAISRDHPGGGGGTFVWINDPPSNPLVIAGGGGGVEKNYSSGTNSQADGQSGNNGGTASAVPTSDTGYPGQQVAVGNGGYFGPNRRQCSGGGAGWLSEGSDSSPGTPSSITKQQPSPCGNFGCFGRDFRLAGNLNDITGSTISSTQKLYGGWGVSSSSNETQGHNGGFGGGGGGGHGGEGGGGGYTGGAGTWSEENFGGGGGSYNGGTNQTNTTGYTSPGGIHGKVIITKI
jgi:hypothetical protein